ncbi:MAG: ATP-binding protein [Chloroflexota bacterium]
MAVTQLETPTFGSRVGNIWKRLTEPPASVKDIEQRRRMQLLSVLLIGIIPVAILAGVTVPFIAHPDAPWKSPVFLAAFFAVFIFLIAFGLNRSGRYSLAAGLMILPFFVSPYYAVIREEGQAGSNRPFMGILGAAVLLTSILFPERRKLIIAFIVGLISTLIFPLFLPVQDFSLVLAPLVTFLAITVLTVLYDDHRTKLEIDRQQELSASLRRSEEANAALIKANSVAKEATRLKSEFMATMSHELRTPLNATLGFSGVLLEGMSGEFDDATRHMIERIESNSKRLLSLINDILDIAKIEAGRFEIVSSPIAPQKLVDSWRSQMSVLAERKGLTFDVELDPNLPNQLYGDPERISQVAINLLSNAFKFTDKGGVKLSLKKANATWLIEVTDTGMGIPPHALNYIFDEFRQLDGSSRRSYGGTGLGLAIVRNLSLMMGGNVRVTSVLGQGSTFIITLPLQMSIEPQAI